MAASQSQRKVASDLFTNDLSNLSSATKYGDETENMSLVVKNDELIDEISMSDSDFEEELEEEPDDPPLTHFADATNKNTGESKFVSYSSLMPSSRMTNRCIELSRISEEKTPNESKNFSVTTANGMNSHYSSSHHEVHDGTKTPTSTKGNKSYSNSILKNHSNVQASRGASFTTKSSTDVFPSEPEPKQSTIVSSSPYAFKQDVRHNDLRCELPQARILATPLSYSEGNDGTKTKTQTSMTTISTASANINSISSSCHGGHDGTKTKTQMQTSITDGNKSQSVSNNQSMAQTSRGASLTAKSSAPAPVQTAPQDHVGTRTQEWASSATNKSQSVLNNQSITQSSREVSLSAKSSAPAPEQVPVPAIEQEQFTNPSSYSIKHATANAKNLFSSSYQKDHVRTTTKEWPSTPENKSQSVLNNQSSREVSLSAKSSVPKQVPVPAIEQEQSTIPSSYSIKHGATTNANNAKNLFSSYQKDHVGTRTQEWASTTTKSVLNNQSIVQSSQRASLTSNSSAKQAAALPIQQGKSTIHSPFSFKQGESALEMLVSDQDSYDRHNFLRLPAGSFHASQHPAQFSWDTSLATTFLRRNLSQVTVLNNAGEVLEIPKDKVTTSLLTFDRTMIYFGFCRLHFDTVKSISLHNIAGQSLWVKCELKASKHDKCKDNFGEDVFEFKNEVDRRGVKVDPGQRHEVELAFRPFDLKFDFSTTLYIECMTRKKESYKYKFKVFGYGGQTIVRPKLSPILALSSTGRYRLCPKNSEHFQFELENTGPLRGFARIEVLYADGKPVPSKLYNMPNSNIILGAANTSSSKQTIEFRYYSTIDHDFRTATDRPLSSTAASTKSSTSRGSAKNIHIAFILAIFWSEERQRMRLKLLEKKLNGSIECCGRSFTAPHIHFSGHKDVPIDIDKVSLPFISKEDFHYFEQRLRVTFVDVLDNKLMQVQRKFQREKLDKTQSVTSLASRGTIRSKSTAAGTGTGVIDSAPTPIMVELEPDNTLMYCQPNEDE